VRTLDRRTSWAPRKNSTRKASAPHPSRSLRYPPHHPFGSGWHHLQQSHAGAFQGAGFWFSKSRNLLPSFMFILSITLPNLSIPDVPFPALLSTLIGRRFQVIKPATLLIPILLFSISFDGGVIKNIDSGSTKRSCNGLYFARALHSSSD